MFSNKILVIGLVFFTLGLGHTTVARAGNADELKKILESLTAIVSGPCFDEFGDEHYCVMCTNKDEAGHFLVVLSEDRTEEVIIIRIVDKIRTIVWQKEKSNMDFE